ncbi:glycerol-3-phosphate 1-O-acyltransferase PlsY [Anaerosalibacter massiliensis]|uniref:Glycerol-3-phosphate acyltransferase n=1 Tax=Anaerosalibacter massiliensis TaxID=1347392 RepID=A0A9X2MEK6_9FIRM|nr:glycerol-3-phosphate 1-O-acyltransferase PlsY [Anaerosalibacter massiliensis]MCR2042545.1 glycerol-3-phosphate 1-O-acyltransferase PlsY [Anaerosalibacter massiliensis]
MGNIIKVIIISYFIGNFSSAYILGKLYEKKDIRNYGSGNAGATNALRVFGIKIGILAFIFDILKGFIAVTVSKNIMGFNGGLIAGLFVVIGHNWPIVLKFRGGKGIAASLGVMLCLNLPTAIICMAIGFLVIAKTRYVSLGSIMATGLVPIVGLFTKKPFNFNFFFFTIALALMAILRHKSNIKRLLNGKESKLGERV